MKKVVLFCVAVLSLAAKAQASEKIDYSCDEVRGTVTVAFEDGKPVAIYGIGDDAGLSQEAYEAEAKDSLLDINLRVSKYKNGIIFTIITDDHEGETQDVRCKRK